jgi:alanine racemase
MVGQLTVNLDAVRSNYRAIQKVTGRAVAVGGVVKADAYGLGARQVARALAQEGCQTFFVATVDEGVAVREEVGAAAQVVVLTGYDDTVGDEYAAHRLAPALASLRQLRRFGDLCERKHVELQCFLQFDTGMNRLGLSGADADHFFANAKALLLHVDLDCVMTHPACAGDADETFTRAQKAVFDGVVARVRASPDIKRGCRASFGNSLSTFRGAEYHYDLVRCGKALYGLNPAPYRCAASPLARVVGLTVPVIQVRDSAAGEFVGYSATHRLERDSALATVAVGFADGFVRGLSNTGCLYWAAAGESYALPIVGTVSMDMMTVDMTAVPALQRPEEGDVLEVIGGQQDADTVARMGGTIASEILTNLGPRFRRVFAGAATPRVTPTAPMPAAAHALPMGRRGGAGRSVRSTQRRDQDPFFGAAPTTSDHF